METVLTQVNISTAVLQDLVTRASKGSTMVDIIPLSCLMQLKVKDGKLIVKTSDNVNFMTTYADIQTDVQDFEIVVESKLLQQLVSKLTTPTTSLSVENNMVVVKANGTYNIPLALDADGVSKIAFPETNFEAKGATKVLTNDEIRSILSLNKSCKSEMKEIPTLFNYYMDNERIFTTNQFKACNNPISMFESPVCLPPNLVELIPYVCDENGVTACQDETSVMFYSTKGELYGKKCLPADLEAYPVNHLVNAFNKEMQHTAKVNKTLLIQALDRICLFTSVLESNKLTLNMDSTGLTFFSDSTKSSEKVNYLEPITSVTEPISMLIDGKFLKEQLTSCASEELIINFSAETGLQIKCGNATLMLCLLGQQ